MSWGGISEKLISDFSLVLKLNNITGNASSAVSCKTADCSKGSGLLFTLYSACVDVRLIVEWGEPSGGQDRQQLVHK